MRRLAAIAFLLLPLTAPAVPGAAQARPPLEARLAACTSGATALARRATFTASMPAVAGTVRMAIRFDLLERGPGDPAFARLRIPAWERWQRSDAGRIGFIYTRTVRGLRAPGAYRARVRFRWYGAGGRILRRARRLTAICRLPDPRPDLRAGALQTGPGLGPGTVTYLLTVTNGGRGAAGPFAVALTTAGMPQPPLAVDGLAAGESRVVAVPGPPCAPGSAVRFVLDSGGAVTESDEADDVVERPCPVAG